MTHLSRPSWWSQLASLLSGSFSASEGLPSEPGLYLGEAAPYDAEDAREAPLTVSRASLLHGLYVIGRSRSGKTTLAKQIITQQIATNDTFTNLDIEGSTHGRALRLIVDKANRERGNIPDLKERYYPEAERTIIIDPTAPSRCVTPFNLLAPDRVYSLFTVVQAFIAALKRVWPEVFAVGHRMEDILRSGALVLGERGFTLSWFDRLFLAPPFAKALARASNYPEAARFWDEYRDLVSKPEFRRWIEAARNKLSEMAGSPFLGPMMETETCIDVATEMDAGRRVLIRLDEPELQDHMALLATLFIAKYELDSSKRAEGARLHLLHLDEAQEYPIESVRRITARRQKRGLGVCVYHQDRSQIDWKVLSSLVGNCQTRVCFSLGEYADAEYMARQLFPLTGGRVKRVKTEKLFGLFEYDVSEPTFWSVAEELAQYATELTRQRVGEAVVSLVVDGETETRFLTVPRLAPLPDVPDEHLAAFIETSNAIHRVSLEDVKRATEKREEQAAFWLTEAKKAAVEEKRRARTP